MKQLVVSLLFGIILISLVSAQQQQTLGEFNRGDIINLLQTCECSEVNFTSVRSAEDGLQVNLINETEAEVNGNVFNLTFPTNENFSFGQYIVTGFGIIGGEEISFIYDFKLVPQDDDFFRLNFDDMPTLIFFVVALVIAGGLAFFKFSLISGSLFAILGFSIGYSLHWGFGLLFVAIGLLIITRGEKS